MSGSPTITVAVRVNGTNIPSTIVTRTLSSTTGSIFNGNILVSLNSGNVIDVGISASQAVAINLGAGVNATLTLKKIS